MNVTKLITFVLITFFALDNHAQQNSDVFKFDELQAAGENIWSEKDSERGNGYKAFKRWEWFNETRLGENKSLAPQGANYIAWRSYLDNLRKADLRNNLSNWEFVGPTTATGGYQGMGRVSCIAFHPTMQNTYWVGTPSGGIWKTTDDGNTWSTNTDFAPVLGVSSIVINPNNPDSMYALTGDGDRGSLSGLTGAPRGDNKSLGVIISTNGGASWDTTGLNFTYNEAVLGRKLLMDPLDTRKLICVTGSGIYRTTDAGANWSKSINGYFIDIEYHPTNPDIIYATTLNFGGNCRLYRSTDNGVSFTSTYIFTNGTRAALATTPAAPNSLFVLVGEKSTGSYEGLYKSTNAGLGLTKIGDQASHTNILGSATDGSSTKGQGWYDLIIEVENNDSNIIYTGGVNDWKSTDGGQTISCLTNWWNSGGFPEVHADKHFFAFHPLKNNRLYECNDGGVYYTDNKGSSWTEISEGLQISQLYKMTLDNEENPTILGGSQDNGTYGRDGNGNGYLATGGDGMECHTDQNNTSTMYAAYARGVLYRNHFNFKFRNQTDKISDNISGTPTGAWVTPYALEPSNQDNIVAGYQYVVRSTDQGNTWSSISSNFTSTGDLRNIALSQSDDQTIYAADFYRIWVTFDQGTNWTSIKTSTSTAPITDVVVDPYSDSIIYITYGGYSAVKKVEKLANNGTNWITSNLTGTLPNVAVNTLAIDSNGADEIYIGTDLGIFYRTKTMNDWERFSNNLPNVVVTDLDIAPNYRKLYAATYGRGIWVTPLEESFGAVGLYPAHLSTSIDTSSTLKVTFNKDIATINSTEIYYYEGNNAGVRITNSTANITINANEATITPDAPLPAGRQIRISIAKGVFSDNDGILSDALDSSNWKFTLNGISDINELVSYSILGIYPSPLNNTLNIKFDKPGYKVKCHISDLQGKSIYASQSYESGIKAVDARNWAQGIYLVTLAVDGGKAYQFKILKH